MFEGVDSPCVSYFYDNTIMCYSFSKSLSLPGERIGYVAVNPACEDAETMINMCGQISRGIGHNCPPSIIQLAVAQVLDKTADLSVYETNMNILYKELLDLGFTCVKPGGTFYIFPKALEEDAKVFSQKALKYDLVLVPGDSFGAPGYFRMAYCVDTEKVERSPHLRSIRRCMPYVQLPVQTKGTGAECQCGLFGYETVLQPGKLIDQRRFVQCGFLLSPDSGLPVSV